MAEVIMLRKHNKNQIQATSYWLIGLICYMIKIVEKLTILKEEMTTQLQDSTQNHILCPQQRVNDQSDDRRRLARSNGNNGRPISRETVSRIVYGVYRNFRRCIVIYNLPRFYTKL